MTKRISLLALLLLAAAGLARAEGVVELSEPAAPDADVSIELTAGAVRVVGWDRDEVRVRAELGRGARDVELTGSPNRIDIELDYDHHGHGHRSASDLEIWVPRGSKLQVETFSASIEVDGVSGRLDLESMSGNISVEGRPSSVIAETISGRIDIEGATSRIDAESVSGAVRIRAGAPAIGAATVSARIEIDAEVVDEIDLESVNGSIRLRAALRPNARVDVEVHSADVTLELPADTSATFDIETFSGDIRNELGPAARRADRYTPARVLEFRSGSGSAEVRIESFSGDVTLRRQ